jgi:hypothetical protein
MLRLLFCDRVMRGVTARRLSFDVGPWGMRPRQAIRIWQRARCVRAIGESVRAVAADRLRCARGKSDQPDVDASGYQLLETFAASAGVARLPTRSSELSRHPRQGKPLALSDLV